MITASMVKELREKTGAGMLDCKKALEANNGDIDASIDWLREKGISKAAKKADRIAAEGVAAILTKGNKAVIIEVNAEIPEPSLIEKLSRMSSSLIQQENHKEILQSFAKNNPTQLATTIQNLSTIISELQALRKNE